MPKKVVILGWYGHGNFGDDCMLLGLKRLFQGWEVTVMSDDNRSTYPVFDVNEVNKHDLLLLGGGELLNANRLFLTTPGWVGKVKIPKVIFGCGANVENPNEFSKEVRAELQQFDFIGLRDTQAYTILRGLTANIGLSYDPVYSLAQKCSKGLGWNRAIVVPTDRTTRQYDEGIQQFNLAKTSKKWLTEQLKTVSSSLFVPFGAQDNDDAATCREFAKQVDNSAVLGRNQNFDSMLSLMGESRLVVAYRLHAMLLAHLAATPYVYYPYHWKLTRVENTIHCLDPLEIKHRQKQVFNKMLEATCS